MNRATRNLNNNLVRSCNRRSLAALLGVVGHRGGDPRRHHGPRVGQAERLQLGTSPTGAASAVSRCDWAHTYGDQTAINFYRSLVFDDQISVLDAC